MGLLATRTPGPKQQVYSDGRGEIAGIGPTTPNRGVQFARKPIRRRCLQHDAGPTRDSTYAITLRVGGGEGSIPEETSSIDARDCLASIEVYTAVGEEALPLRLGVRGWIAEAAGHDYCPRHRGLSASE